MLTVPAVDTKTLPYLTTKKKHIVKIIKPIKPVISSFSPTNRVSILEVKYSTCDPSLLRCSVSGQI